MNFDPRQLKTEPLRRAYAYWDRQRAGRPMPSRRDIDPVDMVEWLPHVTLVTVTHDPLDFRFRLVGTAVVARYGREFTGERLADLDLDGKAKEIFAEYAQPVNRRQPQYYIDNYVMESGRQMHFERLLLPLSSDGETVDMLLGIQYDFQEPGRTGLQRL